jgi:hypothetical protein
VTDSDSSSHQIDDEMMYEDKRNENKLSNTDNDLGKSIAVRPGLKWNRHRGKRLGSLSEKFAKSLLKQKGKRFGEKRIFSTRLGK